MGPGAGNTGKRAGRQKGVAGPLAQGHPAQQWRACTSSASGSEWAGGGSDRWLEHTGGLARSWRALNATSLGAPSVTLYKATVIESR